VSTTIHSKSRPTAGVGRLVRRLERERRRWTLRDNGPELVATEQAWRAGVAEGLRLAQTAIRKGV
jgi:anti-sigma regulatory factor (Ser/Thr protein kinase)